MPNRTICSVLEAMRDCTKTQNYSYLLGLIEEAQMLANRMESALYDKKDFKYDLKRHKKLRKQIKEMEEKLEDKNEA